MSLIEDTTKKLNRLAKWRALLAGWQLGTRDKDDPEVQAIRDHREVTLMLRAENSALLTLLIQKGVFTESEWLHRLGLEADALNDSLEQRFPGVTAEDFGLSLDPVKIQPWMKDWRP